MTVSRDVITDLLPLYIAGEASPGSARLVAEYLAGDRALAAEVERQRREAVLATEFPPRPELELQALTRTRRVLAMRQWAFGVAWFFTALSFSLIVRVNASGGTDVQLLVEKYWRMLWWLPLSAAIAWGCYAALRRRTRL